MRVTDAVVGVLILAVSGLTGCHKKPKVEFERPPAVASIPETPANPEVPSTDETKEPDSQPEPVVEPTPTEAESPPPKPVRRRKPLPPPEPQPPPDPHEPRLTEGSDSPEVRSIRNKLARTVAILNIVEKQLLTKEQIEQAASARAFVNQAQEALEEGDYRRAAVLADKGLILAQDVRESARAKRN
jgi:outer membrane biosynthesis protein TonB